METDTVGVAERVLAGDSRRFHRRTYSVTVPSAVVSEGFQGTVSEAAPRERTMLVAGLGLHPAAAHRLPRPEFSKAASLAIRNSPIPPRRQPPFQGSQSPEWVRPQWNTRMASLRYSPSRGGVTL